MFEVPTGECHKGNTAVVACYDPICSSPALLCIHNDCSCHQHHPSTHNVVIFSKFINELMERSRCLGKADEKVISWIDQRIKKLTVLKEELSSKILNPELNLREEGKTLIQVLRKNQYSLIVPSLVFGARKQLTEDQSIDFDSPRFQEEIELINFEFDRISQRVLDLFGNASRCTKSVDNEEVPESFHAARKLDNIPAAINSSQSVAEMRSNFKVSSIFKYPDIQITGNIIEKTTNNGEYNFALLDPPISLLVRQSARFRMREGCGWLYLGLCHRNTVSQNQFQFLSSKDKPNGCFMAESGGVLSSTFGRSSSVSTFQFEKGDVISIEYIPSLSSALLTNKRTAMSLTLKVTQEKDNPLCFCVAMGARTSVEYLGTE